MLNRVGEVTAPYSDPVLVGKRVLKFCRAEFDSLSPKLFIKGFGVLGFFYKYFPFN